MYNLSHEALSNLSPETNLSILGGSGFIGSSMLTSLFQAGTRIASLDIATRNPDTSKKKLSDSIKNLSPNTELIPCNHLQPMQVKSAIAKASIIFDFAGLAWQHPGGEPLPKMMLLQEELIQNALSAFIIGSQIKESQKLIWTSTSAIDGMLSRVNEEQQKQLDLESSMLTNQILTQIDPHEGTIQNYQQAMGEILSTFNFLSLPKFPGSKENVLFATEFSYAYSKWIGEKILTKLSQKNIHALRISDVYGPGQDISSTILNPTLPARRIQRYIAAYREISRGNTSWIPDNETGIYGFTQHQKGEIVQHSWNDSVFPTHVRDVSELVLRSLKLHDNQKTILAVNGNKMSNIELMQELQSFFGTKVKLIPDPELSYSMPQCSEDLPLLGISTEELIPFSIGLKEWVSLS
jgi:nucleoside-diphosphate-sugar epimerase